MDDKEREKVIAILSEGHDVFLKSLAGISNGNGRRSPAEGRWSILQCVEHIAVAEEYLLAQINKATTATDAVHIPPGRERIILRRGSDRTKPVESPDPGKPRGQYFTVEEAVHAFHSARQRTLQFVNSCEGDLRGMITTHPLLGPANCQEMLLLIAVHPLRHAKQVIEIRSALGL